MAVVMYGIPNCDTVKKAKTWLDDNGIAYQFHDYKKHGIDKDVLDAWVNELGWEVLLNTRGTTWRKLPEDKKTSIDAEKAIALMIESPSMIKRPVLDNGCKRVVGFSEGNYRSALL